MRTPLGTTRLVLVLASLVPLVAPAVAAAQQPATGAATSLHVGDRVRARYFGERRIGTVASIDSVVRVSFSGDTTTLDAASRIQRSLGPRSRLAGLGRGAGYGTLFGAATGAVIGFLHGDDTGSCFICLTAGEKALLGGATIGLAGGVIGGVVGLAAPGERWETIDRGGVRATLSPDRDGGVMLGLTVAVD